MPAGIPVHLFEEHSSTLALWWQHRGAPLTVVYLDAHLDLQQTDAAKIRALRACETVEHVRLLESLHHLNPSDRYSYGIENFLYAAVELGLIGRLVWVAPPHIPRAYSPSLVQYVQQMDGISFEELTGFVQAGKGAMRGKLLGLDLTICDFRDLEYLGIGSDYVLDIDIDYFVVVPGDRLWIDPRTVIRSVTGKLGTPGLATVSRAVGSGFTPLHLRFFGDYVRALLSGQEEKIERYANLVEAARSLDSGAWNDVTTRCRRAVEERPDCAASHYLLAMASRDAGTSNLLRAKAASLDASYRFELSREASGYTNRQRTIGTQRLRELSSRLVRMEPGTERRALAELALGQLYARLGYVQDARRLLDKQTGELAGHGGLAFSIASRLLSGPTPDDAKALLRKARRLDKTRTGAVLSLGDLALRAGDARGALAFYSEASERAPAWVLPLERLGRCYELLGDSRRATQLTRLINDRKRVLMRLPGMSAGGAVAVSGAN